MANFTFKSIPDVFEIVGIDSSDIIDDYIRSQSYFNQTMYLLNVVFEFDSLNSTQNVYSYLTTSGDDLLLLLMMMIIVMLISRS